MIYRNARPVGGTGLVDLHVLDGRFAARAEGAEEDLEGAWVLPGLWDTHLHLGWYSVGLTRLELSDCPSREELFHRVREFPGEWVIGQGWTQDRWRDPRPPTRLELDEAGGGRPVVLFRADLHSAACSTAALRHAGFGEGSPDPEGGKLDFEHGWVFELAVAPVSAALPELSLQARRDALRAGARRLNEWGITGVVDQRLPEGEDFPFDLYQELGLPLRIHCNRAPHQQWTGPSTDRVRRGHLKLFSDGSMGSRTARMLEPYPGTQARGIWITPPAELERHFLGERDRLSIHAIGDEALRAVLDLFERHGVVEGDRIEHVQLLSDADLPRLAQLRLVASMQPVHLLDDEALALDLFGEEARRYYRLGSLLRHGTRLGFGSDAPVATPDPWLGLQAAVHRTPRFFPQERIPVWEALQAYTSAAARDLGWDDSGRLDVGCLADFIVVDRDPLQTEDLTSVRVLKTIAS